jgi:hypothetical protein
MRIYFSSSDPSLRISDETTNKDGKFETPTFNLPPVSGSYLIQAHFGKTVPYDSSDSNIVVLKVRSHAPLAEPPNRENTTDTPFVGKR